MAPLDRRRMLKNTTTPFVWKIEGTYCTKSRAQFSTDREHVCEEILGLTRSGLWKSRLKWGSLPVTDTLLRQGLAALSGVPDIRNRSSRNVRLILMIRQYPDCPQTPNTKLANWLLGSPFETPVNPPVAKKSRLRPHTWTVHQPAAYWIVLGPLRHPFSDCAETSGRSLDHLSPRTRGF